MGNVLVDLRRRALLADFGLSRAVQEGPSGLTTSHGLKGTLRYYSPELLSEENAKLTLQSDVWAWACLGVEILGEAIPYANQRTEFGLIKAIVSGKPPVNLQESATFAPALKELIGKCWVADPQQRPTSEACLQIMNQETSEYVKSSME